MFGKKLHFKSIYEISWAAGQSKSKFYNNIKLVFIEVKNQMISRE